MSDLDLIEINEAFAAVAVQSMKDLGVSTEKVNVNGGAIALGHPIGMSGARLVLHLALELKRRGGGVGAAALCGGGGQGDALIVRGAQGLSQPFAVFPLVNVVNGAVMQDVSSLVAQAREGRPRAVARLISLVEGRPRSSGRSWRPSRRSRATPTWSASPAPRASASRRRPRRW